jgi:hypothetical protein
MEQIARLAAAIAATLALSAGPALSDTVALTAGQNGAINAHVQKCWTWDTARPDSVNQSIVLTVTTDAAGNARKTIITGDDVPRAASDPRFRAFAERAMRAILDPRCANLPLPPNALGRVNVLTFRFTP